MAGTFQRAGKEHIRYIRECARKAWERSNGTVPFEACIVDALKQHRDHIKRIIDATNHFNESRNASYGEGGNSYSALND